jgi:two-component system chemotaxis response regulator CheB
LIRVLIVDDSAVIRKMLAAELSKFEDIEVVGSAIDPYAARDKLVSLRPDVLTLDLEMPKMDGLSFLAKLMENHPMPVVVVSSLTPENSETALRALELGAIEVMAKPRSAYSLPDMMSLARAIRAAAGARVTNRREAPKPASSDTLAHPTHLQTTHKIIAIGASTGGTVAIEQVLKSLPMTTPGTVICQHMPEHFTKTFAARLDKVCQMEVREARDGDYLAPGVALVAPGRFHMVLQRNGARYLVRIKDGPMVHYQRPSVDVLFQSVARNAGRNAVGVILTGMGADGAKGLLAMKESGARTIAQDEKSCIVYGMPKEAVQLGAADEIVPLSNVAQTILNSLRTNSSLPKAVS